MRQWQVIAPLLPPPPRPGKQSTIFFFFFFFYYKTSSQYSVLLGVEKKKRKKRVTVYKLRDLCNYVTSELHILWEGLGGGSYPLDQ